MAEFAPMVMDGAVMGPGGRSVMAGEDRQSGDGQVGGPYSSPGDPGNPMPEPDDTDLEDDRGGVARW